MPAHNDQNQPERNELTAQERIERASFEEAADELIARVKTEKDQSPTPPFEPTHKELGDEIARRLKQRTEFEQIISDFADTDPFVIAPKVEGRYSDRITITCSACKRSAVNIQGYQPHEVPHLERCPWIRARRAMGKSTSFRAVPEKRSADCKDCVWSAEGDRGAVAERANVHIIGTNHTVDFSE